MRFRLVRICKGESISAIPQEIIRFDFHASARNLKEQGYQVEDKEVMLIARKDGLEVTAYVNGRLMLNPMNDKERAKVVADGFYSLMIEEKVD